MPGWDDLLKELNPKVDLDGNVCPGLTYDQLRTKYLKKLHDVNGGRNVITYYSGWLNGATKNDSADICDKDMTGFMNVVKGMDGSKGLDLVLHTPGGYPTAVEGIVKYLHGKFDNDIRVIVPHMAMSAGTMLACSAHEIVMGLHSVLGPIDPQWNGIPVYNILEEFSQAKADLRANPDMAAYWEIQLEKYPPAFYNTGVDAISLSSALTGEWLQKYMFAGEEDASAKTNAILNVLNNNNQSHSRHFNIEDCRNMGLRVTALEEDEDFQDAVLSLHHAYTITFDGTSAIKIIENHLGNRYVISMGNK